MAGKQKKHWQIRRELLIKLLPKYNWSIQNAAQDKSIGYSKYYAETRLPYILEKDVNFCRAVEREKARILVKSDIEVTEIVQELRKTVDELPVNSSVRIKALELLGRYKAMFADKQIIEDGDRRRQLDEQEQQEAQRLAILALNQDKKTG